MSTADSDPMMIHLHERNEHGVTLAEAAATVAVAVNHGHAMTCTGIADYDAFHSALVEDVRALSGVGAALLSESGDAEMIEAGNRAHNLVMDDEGFAFLAGVAYPCVIAGHDCLVLD